jgi:BirA family transcriptional regulator, biotin operon repressor / biotin---[acetyl-CoA-carboxylase] ligase
MNTLFTGQNRINLKTVDSTNNFAAKLVELPDWANGTVIVADWQLEGRGQRGRQWLSEPGQNIICSFLFRVSFLPLENLYQWNQAVAIAVLKTLESFNVPNLRIKWPNDILQGGRKLSGILIENSIQGKSLNHSIVGIGINVNQSKFDGLSASSIIEAIGEPADTEKVIQVLCEQIEAQYMLLRSGNQVGLGLYYDNLFALEEWRTFEIQGESHRAKLKKIDTNGLGLFEFENSEEKWLGHTEVKWFL